MSTELLASDDSELALSEEDLEELRSMENASRSNSEQDQKEELQPPEVGEFIESLLEKVDSPFLRNALYSESVKEMGPELKQLLNTIIGIKLLALEKNDQALFDSAQDVYEAAVLGDKSALSICEKASQIALAHDKNVSEARKTKDEEDRNQYIQTAVNEQLKIIKGCEDTIDRLNKTLERLDLDDEAVAKAKSELFYAEKNISTAQENIINIQNEFRNTTESESMPELLNYDSLAIVHATDMEPRTYSKSDGLMHIEDRFTGSGSETAIPRPTVHVALNHMVESVNFGGDDWSNKRILVVSPMDKVVGLNGEPTSLEGQDTWWETAPYEGLRLPSETIVIKPGSTEPVSELTKPSGANSYEIRYKDAGITEEDIATLIQQSPAYELRQLAQKLGGIGYEIDTSYYYRGKGDSLGRTALTKYETDFRGYESEQNARNDIAAKLIELLSVDRKVAEPLFAYLAKMVALRKAMGSMGRQLIEPAPAGSGQSFMSTEISDALKSIAEKKGTVGLHSESSIGILEKDIIKMEDRIKLRKEIVDSPRFKSIVSDINLNSMQMLYRMGLF